MADAQNDFNVAATEAVALLAARLDAIEKLIAELVPAIEGFEKNVNSTFNLVADGLDSLDRRVVLAGQVLEVLVGQKEF